MKRNFLCLGLIFASLCTTAAMPVPGAPAPAVNLQVPANLWASDVHALQAAVLRLHPFLSDEDRRRFAEKAEALKADHSRSPDEMLVGAMQLLASLGDGHSVLSPAMQPGLRLYPLRLQLLQGGLYLTGADRKYSRLLGARLLSIGEVGADDLIKRARTVTSGDNDSSVDGRIGINLVSPDVLAGLGITAGGRPPVYRFTLGKGELALVPDAVPVMPGHPSSDAKGRYSDDWVDLAPATAPLWLARQNEAYWSEYLPDTQTIYVQYNRADNDPANPMPSFARQLRQDIDTRKPARVILDLRHNSGGESFWNKPLFLALLRPDLLEQPGRLFVLIGRDTFSAGNLLAIELEKYSRAIFVGEPTGGALQNFGNHEPVRLPATGLTALVATKYYQNDGPNDVRRWIAPSVAAVAMVDDLRLGRDPALDAVLRYEAPEARVKSAVLSASASDVGGAARKILADPTYRYLDSEPVLTGIGYQLLKAGDVPRAVAVMELAAAMNPDKANAHDSLGDAYRAAGQQDRAIAAYRKALEIAPGWESSRQSLRALGVTDLPPAH
jgi:tetratricopeptide (TPR) repeat protein